MRNFLRDVTQFTNDLIEGEESTINESDPYQVIAKQLAELIAQQTKPGESDAYDDLWHVFSRSVLGRCMISQMRKPTARKASDIAKLVKEIGVPDSKSIKISLLTAADSCSDEAGDDAAAMMLLRAAAKIDESLSDDTEEGDTGGKTGA